MKTFKWLSRDFAKEGPDFTLVRSQKAFNKALLHCGYTHPKNTPPKLWMLPEPAQATCHHIEQNQTPWPVCIVAIRATCFTHTGIQVASLLVHEAVHIVQDYFEKMGEHTPASEQQAYAIQIVAEELMNEYCRQTKVTL